MVKCIWHKGADNPPSLEDILLAGGPEEVVFRNGEVCRPCNNGCGHLDQAVRDTLDIPAFHFGGRDRHGRPSQVQNRRNLKGFYDETGKVVGVNLGSRDVTMPSGVVLPARRGGGRDVQGTIEVLNPATGEAQITMTITIGDDPKFIRGIHKMAFELLAFRVGADAVLGEEYDAVRDFVRHGRGNRYILSKLNTDNMVYGVPPYHLTGPDGGKAMTFCVFGMDFFVDLTPTQPNHGNLMRKIKELGSTEWMCCPPWTDAAA